MRPMRTSALAVVLALVVVACGESGPTPVQVAGSPDPASSPASRRRPPRVPPRHRPPRRRPRRSRSTSRRWRTRLHGHVVHRGRRDRRDRTLGKVKSKTTGTLAIDGGATHMVRTTTTGKTKVKVETITANGTRYTKQKGVWVETRRVEEQRAHRPASRHDDHDRPRASRRRTARSSITCRRRCPGSRPSSRSAVMRRTPRRRWTRG